MKEIQRVIIVLVCVIVSTSLNAMLTTTLRRISSEAAQKRTWIGGTGDTPFVQELRKREKAQERERERHLQLIKDYREKHGKAQTDEERKKWDEKIKNEQSHLDFHDWLFGGKSE